MNIYFLWRQFPVSYFLSTQGEWGPPGGWRPFVLGAQEKWWGEIDGAKGPVWMEAELILH